MNFVSARLITSDARRLVSFYERVTGLSATWYTEDFAEVATPTATLAIGSTRTMQLFGSAAETTPETKPADKDAARPGGPILEFLVADVDAVYAALGAALTDVVQAPTTMPWGNRSLLIRDPDGTLVNFFTPVTPQAIAKFAMAAR